GAIAIAMATELRKKARDFSIVAVDKSRAALDLAAENAATLDAIEKIRFVESDWYAALPKGSKFNLIISNPPYIKEGDQNVSISTKFEPNSALYAGVDGLKDIKIIIQGLSEYLEPTGSFLCEIGSDQEDLIRNLVLEISPDLFKSIKFIKDLAGRSRVLSIKRGTEPN
ncbi:MAG: HemK/PrmC family methyltransferase, partial [bacterium]|nr:HemK/PrmC family methyltransferase [bacterium]